MVAVASRYKTMKDQPNGKFICIGDIFGFKLAIFFLHIFCFMDLMVYFKSIAPTFSPGRGLKQAASFHCQPVVFLKSGVRRKSVPRGVTGGTAARLHPSVSTLL